jgi:hypothetical protein
MKRLMGTIVIIAPSGFRILEIVGFVKSVILQHVRIVESLNLKRRFFSVPIALLRSSNVI